MSYHTSVLLNQSVDLLNVSANGTYVDATFGGGGHSREILSRLKNGRLIAFDQDEDAFRNKIDDDRFTLVRGNFRFIKNYLRFHDAFPVDGILADLGLSSFQIDEVGRGFSFSKNADLDMRMNCSSSLSAKEWINEIDPESMLKVFREYGEINNAYKLVESITKNRISKPIKTTEDLSVIASKYAIPGKENKYLAKVFQAIRIEINDEIGALSEFLSSTYDSLKDGGRFVVISYHSLEDRLVKDLFREEIETEEFQQLVMGVRIKKWNVITRKAIVPNDTEIDSNSRARSAKLRVAEKSKC